MKAEKRLQKILEIAAEVRATQELHAHWACWDSSTLAGVCGISSVVIAKRCQRSNIKVGLAWSSYHCFNLFRMKRKLYILDVTATQFSPINEEIFISPFDNRTENHNPDFTYFSLEKLSKDNFKDDWEINWVAKYLEDSWPSNKEINLKAVGKRKYELLSSCKSELSTL